MHSFVKGSTFMKKSACIQSIIQSIIFYYIVNYILLHSQLYFTIQLIIVNYSGFVIKEFSPDFPFSAACTRTNDPALVYILFYYIVNYILLYSQLYFTTQSSIFYYIVNYILPYSKFSPDFPFFAACTSTNYPSSVGLYD